MSAMRSRAVQRVRGLLLAAIAFVLLGAAGAQAKPFAVDDVFVNSGSLQEFTPSGQLVQTLATGTGFTAVCVSPSGRYLVAPGVGLYNSSGVRLPSSWAADAADGVAGQCVVDGYGNVFVMLNAEQLSEYTLTGSLERTITLPGLAGIPPLSIALSPDPCVLYWGLFLPVNPDLGVARYDVCTNTALTSFSSNNSNDAMAALPDGRVISVAQYDAVLLNAQGANTGISYTTQPLSELGGLAVDPDNSTVWVDGAESTSFDIDTGQQLTQFSPDGSLAAFAPPLAGNANIGPDASPLPAGIAAATKFTAGYSDPLTELNLFLDSSSTPTALNLGIYANSTGRPGALLAQGTVANPTAGAWNFAAVSGVSLTAGQTYWLAELAPAGSSPISLATGPSRALTWYAGTKLTTLPASWPASLPWYARTPSAYGN